MPEDRHELEGVKRRGGRGGFPWVGAGFFILVCLGAVLVLFFPGKLKRGLKEIFGSEPAPVTREVPKPAPSVEPVDPVEPEVPLTPFEIDPDPPFPTGVFRPPEGTDIRKLSNGIDLKVTLNTEKGELASKERMNRNSYTAEYTLTVRVPKASQTIEELSTVNPHLGTLLPGLEKLLPSAKVSPWFDKMYSNKTSRVKNSVGKLADLLSRHNFYDCETMLNLRDPDSGRRAFLVQSEMDVVSDGSDGDRLPIMPDNIVKSTNYQPFTSYSWKKTTRTPNPMVAGWEERIKNAREELGKAETSADRKTWLRERIAMLQRGIQDMKARSFLIAEYDPFIVIPTHMVTDRNDPYAPNVGDFAVVIHGKKLYPAIVGDAGPTFKVGEASLRMAKELNADATPYRRPVSDLTVTYLVFPRSADDPKRAPDYVRWKERCAELLKEIGGLGEGVELHEWKNLLPTAEAEAG